MGKAKEFFRKVGLWFGFAMKSGDTVIMHGDGEEDSNKMSQEQKIFSKSVYDDLLNGVETEQVKELRYTMYRAANESLNYEYLGNGIAVKVENKHKKELEHLRRIRQDNKPIVMPLWFDCQGVEEGTVLNGEDILSEKYTFEMEYDNMPRFRIEKFAKGTKIEIEGKKIQLLFSTYPDIEKPITKALCNELEKAIGKEGYGFNQTFFGEGVKLFRFIANGIGFGNYDMEVIIENIKFDSVVKDGNYYVLNGVFEEITMNSMDNDYYHNDRMEKLYSEKAPREGANTVDYMSEVANDEVGGVTGLNDEGVPSIESFDLDINDCEFERLKDEYEEELRRLRENNTNINKE